MPDERPADADREETARPRPDEREHGSESDERDRAAQPPGGGHRKPSGVLDKTVSVATDAARGSVSGVFRGSAAATRGGVAIAEAAIRVTYWPAQLCVLAAILLPVRLPD